MIAAVLTKLNAPLELMKLQHAYVSHDRFCANGQVLLRMICSGICGSQLQEIQGNKGNERFLPHTLGHEGCGIVQQVGPGVNSQLIGKRVVAHWRTGSGPEAVIPASYEAASGMRVGGGHVTTLAESVVVSANRVTPVPDDTPDELCTLLGCSLSTALGTVEQEAKLKFGESCLIVGCGGVGLNLIMAARLAGAWPIVAMDITDDKALAVLPLGAQRYVNAKNETIRGDRFDVIIDTTGSVEAIESTMGLLSDNGRYVLIGQTKPNQDFRVLNAVQHFHGIGSRIIWTQGGGFRPSLDIPRYTALWRGGYLNLSGIISHRIGLSEVNRGIDLVKAGQAGRILVMMK